MIIGTAPKKWTQPQRGGMFHGAPPELEVRCWPVGYKQGGPPGLPRRRFRLDRVGYLPQRRAK